MNVNPKFIEFRRSRLLGRAFMVAWLHYVARRLCHIEILSYCIELWNRVLNIVVMHPCRFYLPSLLEGKLEGGIGMQDGSVTMLSALSKTGETSLTDFTYRGV